MRSQSPAVRVLSPRMAQETVTLKDRLSRLTRAQAKKLLGPRGEELLRQSAKFEITDLAAQVRLEAHRFTVTLDRGPVVTFSEAAAMALFIAISCSACKG